MLSSCRNDLERPNQLICDWKFNFLLFVCEESNTGIQSTKTQQEADSYICRDPASEEALLNYVMSLEKAIQTSLDRGYISEQHVKLLKEEFNLQ